MCVVYAGKTAQSLQSFAFSSQGVRAAHIMSVACDARVSFSCPSQFGVTA